MKIKITFENKQNEELELFWELEKNKIVFLWLKKILKIFKYDFSLRSRWSGFQSENVKNKYLLEKLKKCIEIINACDYINYKIPFLDVEEYNVDLHNMYHHHFEVLMGKSWESSSFLKEARKRDDQLLISAISDLNELSHDLIDSKLEFPIPIITNIISSNKINNSFLPDYADNYFTLENFFGGIYFHYSQIGKNLLEFLIDNDNVISKKDVETLKNFNGEFDICFIQNVFIDSEDYKKLFSFIKQKLENINENIENKKLRLGKILIARPLFENNNDEIFNKIKKFDKIKNITFIGKNKIISRKISNYDDID